MSQKEVDRHHIITRRINGELKITTRHLRRLVEGFKKEGVKALTHIYQVSNCSAPISLSKKSMNESVRVLRKIGKSSNFYLMLCFS